MRFDGADWIYVAYSACRKGAHYLHHCVGYICACVMIPSSSATYRIICTVSLHFC